MNTPTDTLTNRDIITLGTVGVTLVGAFFAFSSSVEVNSAELIRMEKKVDAVESRANERIGDLKLTLRRMEDKLDHILTLRK